MAITGSSSSASTSDVGRTVGRVVIGVPVHDYAEEGARLVEQIRELTSAAPIGEACQIVVAHPAEGTSERRVENDRIEVSYPRPPADALQVPWHGLPGRARAVQAIFREAQAAGAACVVVDPRSASSPGWLDGFAEAVSHDVDFVAPVYGRHPFNGALLRGVIQPMFRALYGARIRNPMGAHFACSARLIAAVADDPVWESDLGQLGIDLWLGSSAASSGMRLAQATIPSRPSEEHLLDVSTTVAQVVGVLFTDLERRARFWQRVRGSHAVTLFGPPLPPEEPRAIDPAPLVEAFRSAHRDLQDVWAEVLPPLATLQWRRLAATTIDNFRVDDVLWAHTVYDFAMGHRLRVIARDHLLRSLTPMYLAWLGSFISEVRYAPMEAAEARLERLHLAFEAEKPYFVSQWRWPERFKPVKVRR